VIITAGDPATTGGGWMLLPPAATPASGRPTRAGGAGVSDGDAMRGAGRGGPEFAIMFLPHSEDNRYHGRRPPHLARRVKDQRRTSRGYEPGAAMVR